MEETGGVRVTEAVSGGRSSNVKVPGCRGPVINVIKPGQILEIQKVLELTILTFDKTTKRAKRKRALNITFVTDDEICRHYRAVIDRELGLNTTPGTRLEVTSPIPLHGDLCLGFNSGDYKVLQTGMEKTESNAGLEEQGGDVEKMEDVGVGGSLLNSASDGSCSERGDLSEALQTTEEVMEELVSVLEECRVVILSAAGESSGIQLKETEAQSVLQEEAGSEQSEALNDGEQGDEQELVKDASSKPTAYVKPTVPEKEEEESQHDLEALQELVNNSSEAEVADVISLQNLESLPVFQNLAFNNRNPEYQRFRIPKEPVTSNEDFYGQRRGQWGGRGVGGGYRGSFSRHDSFNRKMRGDSASSEGNSNQGYPESDSTTSVRDRPHEIYPDFEGISPNSYDDRDGDTFHDYFSDEDVDPELDHSTYAYQFPVVNFSHHWQTYYSRNPEQRCEIGVGSSEEVRQSQMYSPIPDASGFEVASSDEEFELTSPPEVTTKVEPPPQSDETSGKVIAPSSSEQVSQILPTPGIQRAEPPLVPPTEPRRDPETSEATGQQRPFNYRDRRKIPLMPEPREHLLSVTRGRAKPISPMFIPRRGGSLSKAAQGEDKRREF